MSNEVCFPLQDGCSIHPADIPAEQCRSNLPPIGFTCEAKYTSSGYSSSGTKIKASSSGHGTSLISKEDACDLALQEAKERAAELLKYKYAVTAMISGYGPDNYRYVAPINGYAKNRWQGTNKTKQWDFKVTAMIPHLETIEPLWVAVQLLRQQTERPYICIVDTGSSPRTLELLERMRSDDLEIHYVRSNNYRHPSQPVAAAMDLAHSLCSTDYLFHTHSDVFLRRNDLIEDLLRLCNEKVPAIGYQMSNRDWITPEWEGMLGHTINLLHLKTIEQTGASWSMERTCREDESLMKSYKVAGGWPDTETGFNRIIKKFGIKPVFIGDDENWIRQKDRNMDHFRSYAGSMLYSTEHFAKAELWMLAAMKEAFERLSLTIK